MIKILFESNDHESPSVCLSEDGDARFVCQCVPSLCLCQPGLQQE